MENKTFTLNERLCADIYNYLEENLNAKNATTFVLLKQTMEKQSIEAQQKEAKDKMKAEIEAEKPKTKKKEVKSNE
ncbi:MAG: hypothetical protein GY928_33580 [Colwellia sp.]|nr:hypothetical protein [Colwellia sp.]